MRVCHPGPVARQRATTSAGKRKEMSCRGVTDRGRPPFFTAARASAASVSSGSSLYSAGLTRCASTRARSDFEVRREASLLTIICLSHAEDVANRATRGIANDNRTTFEHAVADDASLAIVFARVFDLYCHAFEYEQRVFEVKAPFRQCPGSLRRVVSNSHGVIVYTLTWRLAGHFSASRVVSRSRVSLPLSRRSSGSLGTPSSSTAAIVSRSGRVRNPAVRARVRSARLKPA